MQSDQYILKGGLSQGKLRYCLKNTRRSGKSRESKVFNVKNVSYDVLKHVSYRGMGYGQNDLGHRAKPYLWVQHLDVFLKVTQHAIDEFIEECIIDDKNQSEPDIDYLYQLNYPSARNLAFENSDYFCQLLLSFPFLIHDPFFSVFSIWKERNLRFVINTLTKVSIKNGFIHMEGEGYFVDKLAHLKNDYFSYELSMYQLIGVTQYFSFESPLGHFQCPESNLQHPPSRYKNVPTSLFVNVNAPNGAYHLNYTTSLN